MKITAIDARKVPPVQRFKIDDLSDVVVIAGPNGVGKTRLVSRFLSFLQNPSADPNMVMTLEATCDEERNDWCETRVVTSSAKGTSKFVRLLQKNRRRRNWKSSILNFESDRSIQKMKPYAFSWDISDPYEEEIGWQTTFGFMRDRFQDTVHAIFRLIEFQKRNIANRAIQLRREGKDSMQLNFSDPMEPFKDVFRQLLSPKELVDPNPKDQQLKYTIDGQEFPFSSLSSGEREVVNIAFDFLLRNPSDCIVFFDEPDLHLHPELSYRMIQTLQNIGSKNQFIICTHSPDIISSALEHSVVFLAPPSYNEAGEPENQARLVKEDDETNQALRLLGHSIGVISLGKKIVLIEGTQSSLDKQTYGSILENRYPNLVLVPSEGKDLIRSFELVSQKVLARTLWGVDFFMVCDHDSAPQAAASGIESLTIGKLKTLSKYHLENYFLEESVWELVFAEMESDESWLRSRIEIRNKLKEIARSVVAYAVALYVSASLRRRVGNVSVMPRGCDGKTVSDLLSLVDGRLTEERTRVVAQLDSDVLKREIQEQYSRVEQSLDADTDDWKSILPGRQILHQFVHQARLELARAKRLYIQRAFDVEFNPFAEIDRIFREFAEF